MGRKKKSKNPKQESSVRDWGIIEYGFLLIFNLLLVYLLFQIIKGVFE